VLPFQVVSLAQAAQTWSFGPVQVSAVQLPIAVQVVQLRSWVVAQDVLS
jgi:hypothetical protein